MKDLVYSKSALGDARRVFGQLQSDANGATALKRKIAITRTDFRRSRIKRDRLAVHEAVLRKATRAGAFHLACRKTGCSQSATVLCASCTRLGACEEHAKAWLCERCERIPYCDWCLSEHPITSFRRPSRFCQKCNLLACTNCMPCSLCRECDRDADTTDEE
jgi:hypothetical protein